MEQKRGLFNRYFFPRDNNPEHFKALDGLRGIAVLIVMLSHASSMDMHFVSFLDFKQTGKSGVFLFFILSAYLLDRQIALAIKNNKADLHYWFNYLFRRFMRIYPLFLFALIFNYWLRTQGLTYGIVMTGWPEIWKHLTLQKMNGVFWSIAVEFKYYFVSPIIMIFISKIIKWNTVNVTLLLITVIAFIMFFTTDMKYNKIDTIPYLPVFLVGTIISLLEVFSKAFDNFSDDDRKRLDYIGLIAIIVFVCTFRTIFSQIVDSPKYVFQQKEYYVAFSLLWATILISTKYSTGILRAIFSFKPLRYIGVISFSLYLFHWPVMKFAGTLEVAQSFKIYIYLIISILLSTITFVLIEKPFSKLKLKKKAKLT